MITISSDILNPTEKLRIQLSVGLNNNEYKNLISVYENAKGVYISINPNIVLKLSYIPPQKKEWDIKQVIYINDRNIYMLNDGLSRFYKKLMVPDRFIYDDKGYVAEINGDNGHECETIGLTKGQVLQVEPSILYDKKGYPLPGVMMRINMKSNEVDLSIDEFESMMRLLQSIQIRQEGMLILQTYLLMRKHPMEIQTQSNKPSPVKKRSIFDRSSEEKEFVKTPPKMDTGDFMNLPDEKIE